MKGKLRFLISAAAGICILSAAQAATRIEINGDELVTGTPPVMSRGFTLVPMRDIFESLGATVKWDAQTQTVFAQRENIGIKIPVGQRQAYINGQAVVLDVPAVNASGYTMVPLRFVSEALGASVDYITRTRTVSITTAGTSADTDAAPAPPAPPAVPAAPAAASSKKGVKMTVLAGTVLPVTLNDHLSSTSSRVGDIFSATLRSSENGDQPFPLDTQVTGVVRAVKQRQGDNPGLVDVDFTQVKLPGGQSVPITGTLVSLDSNSVEQVNGRMVVKPSAPKTASFIGYGAGAGLLIGMLGNKNNVVGDTLAGAAVGYIASLLIKDGPRDVEVSPGTTFGVRLNADKSWQASTEFARARNAYLGIP